MDKKADLWFSPQVGFYMQFWSGLRGVILLVFDHRFDPQTENQHRKGQKHPSALFLPIRLIFVLLHITYPQG